MGNTIHNHSNYYFIDLPPYRIQKLDDIKTMQQLTPKYPILWEIITITHYDNSELQTIENDLMNRGIYTTITEDFTEWCKTYPFKTDTTVYNRIIKLILTNIYQHQYSDNHPLSNENKSIVYIKTYDDSHIDPKKFISICTSQSVWDHYLLNAMKIYNELDNQ